MNVYIKAAALGLAVTAMGANGAIAGKTTTPNPTSPPVVTTMTIAAFPVGSAVPANSSFLDLFLGRYRSALRLEVGLLTRDDVSVLE